MTNRDILQTALQQSAMDSNCRPEDFLSAENKVVLSKKNPAARKYLELPFLCDFTSYGSNIVASVSPEYRKIAQSYLEKNSVSQCFETPSLHTLIENLRPYQQTGSRNSAIGKGSLLLCRLVQPSLCAKCHCRGFQTGMGTDDREIPAVYCRNAVTGQFLTKQTAKRRCPASAPQNRSAPIYCPGKRTPEAPAGTASPGTAAPAAHEAAGFLRPFG